jgi:hypothetical protein
VHEMKRYVAGEDIEQWLPLVDWLLRPRDAPAPPPANGSATEPAAGETARESKAPGGVDEVTALSPPRLALA